jgi:hypothetical protein
VKTFELQKLSTTELVDRFAALGLGEYQAELEYDSAKEIVCCARCVR